MAGTGQPLQQDTGPFHKVIGIFSPEPAVQAVWYGCMGNHLRVSLLKIIIKVILQNFNDLELMMTCVVQERQGGVINCLECSLRADDAGDRD